MFYLAVYGLQPNGFVDLYITSIGILNTISSIRAPTDDNCVTPELTPETRSQSDPATMSYRQNSLLPSNPEGK